MLHAGDLQVFRVDEPVEPQPLVLRALLLDVETKYIIALAAHEYDLRLALDLIERRFPPRAERPSAGIPRILVHSIRRKVARAAVHVIEPSAHHQQPAAKNIGIGADHPAPEQRPTAVSGEVDATLV